MVFSSEIFLFAFLPLTLGLYFCVRRARNTVLLAMSALFYIWGEGYFVFLVAGVALANWLFGLQIERAKERSLPDRARALVAAAVAIDLVPLLFFKYADFAIGNLNGLSATLHGPAFGLFAAYLPLGISFYTFHAISYVVDVYRGKAVAQKSAAQVALYFGFFPQLIAGPIIRYHDVYRQLTDRTVTRADFVYGIRRFVAGLGKKVLIANTLGFQADRIFALPAQQLGADVAWLGIVAYTLQIYFDFSGYSDMAIGLARMFGFRFLENFNHPYISQSITEFWRRWHISLSNWFRDYLYIPLGGNRMGPDRTYVNLFIVFLLCGLWHGAKWTFVAWGLFYGLFLILERSRVIDIPVGSRWRPLRHAYALLVVVCAWVFFRSDTLPQALAYLATMFGLETPAVRATFAGAYVDGQTVVALVAGAIFSTPVASIVRTRMSDALRDASERARLVAYGCSAAGFAALFAVSTMKLAAGTYNPFIYFRF